MATKQMVSTVEMQYGGRLVERGELFAFGGQRNDQRLEDHRFVREPDPDREPERCECGKAFEAVGHLSAHQAKHHNPRETVQVGSAASPRRGDRRAPAQREAQPMSDREFADRVAV